MNLKRCVRTSIVGMLILALSGCGSMLSGDNPTPNKFTAGKRSKGALKRNANNAVLVQNTNPNPTGNLWKTLPSGFQIKYSADNPQIQEQIQWFIKNQGYLTRTTQRAAPYMYLIYDQVKQRNLPTELVLLPIIESAYYPFAYSASGAAGLWQLMPGTASNFGIKRDSWYDGRRDIFVSTTAALDYLNYLGNYFNDDWLLAIAAYDAGEGTIQNAIHRNERSGQNTDFWSLPLRAETRAYVPRLLALVEILKHPERYPIKLPAINDQPYLAQVDVGSQIKLQDAARYAGLSLAELKTLNPGYSRFSTDPKGKVHKLLLPIEKVEDFKANLGVSTQTAAINWGRYRVQQGDTLSSIAARFHTTVSNLRRVNNIDIDSDVSAGAVLQIPNTNTAPTVHNLVVNTPVENTLPTALPTTTTVVTTPAIGISSNNTLTNTVVSKDDNSTDSDDNDADTTAPAKPQTSTLYHTIKPRETLSSIAKRYGVSVANLRSWNHLRPTAPLKVNSKLVIYQQASNADDDSDTAITTVTTQTKVAKTSVSKNSGTSKYKVRPGDTFLRIAKRFNMSGTELKAANPGVNTAKLKPGQVIVVSSIG